MTSTPIDFSAASCTSYSLHSRRRSRRLWFVLSNISIFSSNNSCCRLSEAECSFDRRFSWKLNAVSLLLVFALLMDAEKTIQNQMYLGKAVNGFLQSCQLIGYSNTVDFCFYERPQEHIWISVLTARVRPVKNRNIEITKTLIYFLLTLHRMFSRTINNKKLFSSKYINKDECKGWAMYSVLAPLYNQISHFWLQMLLLACTVWIHFCILKMLVLLFLLFYDFNSSLRLWFQLSL